MRRPLWIVLPLLLLGLWVWSGQRVSAPPMVVADGGPMATTALPREVRVADATRYPAFLPVEAHEVLQRIERGGPFAYHQDGGVFQNRERRLPPQPRGYYREYTVETPGSADRGARRIIAGGQPPRDYWYTDDHYRSFRSFRLHAAEARR